jgi:hypothetical protein
MRLFLWLLLLVSLKLFQYPILLILL